MIPDCIKFRATWTASIQLNGDEMITISKGVIKISGTYGSNYSQGKKVFDMRDDDGNEIEIGLDVIKFAVSCISYNEKVSSVAKLLQKIDKNLKG